MYKIQIPTDVTGMCRMMRYMLDYICYSLVCMLQTERLVATVEGHTSRLTSAQFCPHYTTTLVTISEDRTFKVYSIYT